jgi:hypothetical protein
MNSLREFALEAWAQEQERRKQSERKKRKRRAKKIEEDIDDLLPRDVDGLRYERNLEDPLWEAVVAVTDTDGSVLRFTYDDDGELSLIGECPGCHGEAMSQPVGSAEDLGEVLEKFAPSSSHDCKPKKK